MVILRNEDAALVAGALDTLGVLLADHHHQWTEGEREIYEQAILLVTPAILDQEFED